MIVCYLCGREYGSRSISIHLPVCSQRFLQQNPHTKLPREPIATLGSKLYNDQAYKIYKWKVLKECQNCHRTFLAESLAKHKKGCYKEKPEPEQYTFNYPASQPRALICFICGQKFTPAGFPIHLKSCRKLRMKQKIYEEVELPPRLWDMILRGQWSEEEVKEFNRLGSGEYEGKQLKECEECNRKFDGNIVEKHRVSCKGSNPSQKKAFRNIPIYYP